YDGFVVEQRAGDLLPGATAEQKIASGFHRNHMINFEGGAIPEEYHTAYIVDRVNTTGTVWLGLTVGCAQCHDHKYDPLTQKEYYQLFAFFHNVPENGLDGRNGNAAPVLRLTTPEQQRRLDRLAARIKELEGRLAPVDAAQAVWERTAAVEPRSKDRLPPAVVRVLALAPDKRNDQDRAALQGYYRAHFSEDAEQLGNELTRVRQERADLDRRVPT